MNYCLNNIEELPEECYPIKGELCLFRINSTELCVVSKVTIPFMSEADDYKNSVLILKDIHSKKDLDPAQQYMYCINAKINGVDSVIRLAITEGRCMFNSETNQIELIEYDNQDIEIKNYMLYTWDSDPEERVIS